MAYATSHNGGRSQGQMNFLGLSGSGDFPFLNAMKSAQSPSYITGGATVNPAELNDDGYPTTISSGGPKWRVTLPPTADRSGRYVLKANGDGVLYINNATVFSGSLTSSNGAVRAVLTIGSTGLIDVGISSITGTIFSDLVVVHEDDEAALDAGEMFGTKFMEVMRELNWGVIRFLDWQDGNKSNVAHWAHRKPTTYLSYSAYYVSAAIYGGVTGGSGDDYTLTFGSGAPTDKQTIVVRFDRASSGASATPTFNLNGTGAKSIRRESGDALTTNAQPVLNSYATLVFDADLDQWLKHGGDANRGSIYLNNGVPPEICFRLCAELGAHPYFVSPKYTLDPSTGYMGSLATYIRDNKPSWMVPKFEGPNEVWNGAGDFFCTRYAWNKANAHWGSSNDHHNWYGKAVSILGQEISAVFSADRSQYDILCGVQTSTTPSSSNDRLNSSRYVTDGGSAAKNWVTAVTVATYISTTVRGTNQELIDAYAYNGGDLTKADDFVDGFGGTSEIPNVAFFKDQYVAWKAWAEGLGVSKMTAYEGGYTPDFDSDAVTSAITGAAKAAQCVLTLATTNMQGIDSHTANSGNPAVVGKTISISGVGGMTELNGNTYTIAAVSGNSVTIDVDSTGFTTFTSGGTATYVGAPLLLNTLREAGRWVAENYYYAQANYLNFLEAGGEYPSQFFLAGSPYSSGGTLGGGQVWGLCDNIYRSKTPVYDFIAEFNSQPTKRVKFRST